MQNKRIQIKGPFIANLPIKHMVHNFKDVEMKDVSHGSVSPRKVCPYVCMQIYFLFCINIAYTFYIFLA